uniref:LAGLIDADG homing endonuclease n=1 Tax=Rhizoctonia solani TaxID=456999 RepID=A0A8E8GQS8_9AGAM|nr:LAGLIDADG homing endonuclease [Rhizoctonia solani]
MEILASVLNCSLLSHKYKTLNPDISKEALSVTVTSTADLSILIDYFNKYPLLGTKGKDFKDWVFIFSRENKNLLISLGKLTRVINLFSVSPIFYMNIGDTAVPGSLLIIPRISTCKVVTRGLSFQELNFSP